MRKIFYLIFISLFLPISAFGVYRVSDSGDIYERLPDGTEIISPITINITLNETAYFYTHCQSLGANNLFIYYTDTNEIEYYSETKPFGLSASFEIPLEIGTRIYYVDVACGKEEEYPIAKFNLRKFNYEGCGSLMNQPAELSLDYGCVEPVFTIIEGKQEGFIDVPVGAIVDILQPAGILFTDTWGLMLIPIGIPIAFYAIGKIIGIMI